jgi:general secretion pathway protein C
MPDNLSDSAGKIDLSLARALFGGEAGAAASTSGIRLKGVYATDGKSLSMAVINQGGRDQAVQIGQKIADGIKLAEVHADHILIDRAGKSEKIELDKLKSTAVTTSAGNNSVRPNASFRLNVASTGNNAYSLSRQELNTVLQDPRQLEFLGRIAPASNGGIRVEDAPAGSLSAKLGLKPGDIITSINGQVVNSPGDLARFYQQFGTLNAIRAEIKRQGVPMLLSYAIQS